MMNETAKNKIVEKLRELADNVEQGKTNIGEISFGKHYNLCLISETGFYQLIETGDSMIQIRFK